ncbi:helix-turn-helix domain-containing protein [Ruthenibacterium lactatiformans]|uniref:helix-turn-helix domain-containing protein n=1 Tax=Ruthenibacterium lactatiformans TaxID=1550024 RepID=UPI0039A07F75
MSELYNLIESLCKEKGTNITAMCKAAKISRAPLTELKMGRSKTLSSATLSKIAAYFGVSVDYLLGNKEKPADQEVDELIKNDPLAGQLFAAYGKVKEEFSQAEIDDITMIMEMIAEKKRRKREKGEE